MSKERYRQPGHKEQQMIESVEVELLAPNDGDRSRYRDMMSAHHYLKSDMLVGEQLRYVAKIDGRWVALLSWSAAAKSLKERENWLGWSGEQKRRRLAFLANNARFLILPGVDCPNLATRILALCSGRLSQDWQQAYGHGILAVESFVDSQLFRGTCYKAQGWSLLGHTQGFERKSQDYYVAHDRPKQLWVRALHPQAREILSAPSLPPELEAEENKVVPITQAGVEDLRGLWELCRHAVPDWRKSKGLDYPLPCLLAIIVMAMLCGVVRGQRDLAAFASKLTQRQLRALRSYRRRDGKYEYPKETTFQRVLAKIDAVAVEKVLRAWEDQMLGEAACGQDKLIAIDGKAQRGSTPHVADEKKAQLVSAQSLPGGRVLGTVLVEEKSNEIPAARTLLDKMGNLEGKLVMLDALHTNQTTLRQILQDNGADYLLPVKDNHEGLATRAAQCLAPPQPVEPPARRNAKSPASHPSAVGPSPLSPARPAVRYRRKRRTQQPLPT
jgi:hypothetical protein